MISIVLSGGEARCFISTWYFLSGDREFLKLLTQTFTRSLRTEFIIIVYLLEFLFSAIRHILECITLETRLLIKSFERFFDVMLVAFLTSILSPS